MVIFEVFVIGHAKGTLGEKQLDNEPESTDQAKKYPDQRNNSTPQLDSEPESADKAKKYPDQRNNSTPQLFIADLKTSREVQKRMPSREASPQGHWLLHSCSFN